MPDDQDAGQGPGVVNSGMIAWLGFFLLVFAVAGLAFYLTDEAGKTSQSHGPALVTQEAR